MGLLLTDFRYPFDTLEWLIIHNALETQYSFGKSLRRWIEIFYKSTEGTVLIQWLRLKVEKTF